MATVRTFISLELPPTVKEALAAVQAQLQDLARRKALPVGAALKWVQPGGIHLTLKFLGAVDETLIPDLSRVVDDAAAGQTPARLRLGHTGAFPDPRRPRVLWVGLLGEVALVARLQERLEAHLEGLGFAAERRAFAPHLTLARVREQATPIERRGVADLLALGAAVEDVAFVAERLALMKSELHPSGARYEAMHTAAVGQ